MPSDHPTDHPAPAEARKSLFGREARRLIKLSVPITVSLAVSVMIGVVDTIMISPLGTIPLAAASIVASIIVIFYSMIFGFISVIGVRLAEAVGEESPERFSITIRSGLIMALVIGVAGCLAMIALEPLMVVIGQPREVLAAMGPYWISMALVLIPFAGLFTLKGLFDALDRPWVGVLFALFAVLVNVPANYLLIHGFGDWEGFGLLGAGLASLLSESLSFGLCYAYWRVSPRFRGWRRRVSADWRECKIQIKEGTSAAFGYLGEAGAYSIIGLMMGGFGATALAANHIVNSIASVLYMVPLGFSIAASIRIAQAIGAKEIDRLRPIGFTALTLAFLSMAAITLGLVFTAGLISDLLSDDEAVVSLATALFIVVAAMQMVDGLQSTALGTLRGMTDNRKPVAMTLAAYWLCGLPIAYLLGFVLGYGPIAVWIGYGISLVIAAAALVSRFLYNTREKALAKRR